MDATLSPETRTYLEGLVSHQKYHRIESLDGTQDTNFGGESSKGSGSSAHEYASFEDGSFIQKVEVPLTFDTEFFDLLQGDVTNLDMLQAVEKESLSSEISALSKEVTVLSKPSKYGKSDLYRWREILYVLFILTILFPAVTVQMAWKSYKPTFRNMPF